MSYQHILVAVDLTPDSQLLIDKAVSLAKPLGAKVSLAHVDVNYAELYTGLVDISMAQSQDQSMAASQRQLGELCEQAEYPISNTLVGAGDLGSELCDTVDKLDIDLVVCGHHQDFWSKLLSSTRQLINCTPVDVLVVPIKE